MSLKFMRKWAHIKQGPWHSSFITQVKVKVLTDWHSFFLSTSVLIIIFFKNVCSSFHWKKWSFKDDTFSFNMLASQTSYRAQGLAQPSLTHYQDACFPTPPPFKEVLGAAKISALCCKTGYCKHMWIYLANRQRTRVKGIFDRHPYPFGNAKVNMNVKPTYLQGEQEDTHREVMKQSTAVNHSQDSFTLPLTKLLLIDGLKRLGWI